MVAVVVLEETVGEMVVQVVGVARSGVMLAKLKWVEAKTEEVGEVVEGRW